MDAVVFLGAALLNMGVRGFRWASRSCASRIRCGRRGTGEAVIGVTLLAAGLTLRARLSWVAFWMSALGIAIGLSSQRVQGAARDLHVVMVPLAIIVLALLLSTRRRQPSTMTPA